MNRRETMFAYLALFTVAVAPACGGAEEPQPLIGDVAAATTRAEPSATAAAPPTAAPTSPPTTVPLTQSSGAAGGATATNVSGQGVVATAVPTNAPAPTQAPAPTATPRPPTPVPPTPIPPTATSAPVANCHPSYPTVCIPPPPPDLDCGDIPHLARFTVLPPDPHRLDGSDNDGLGCESN